MSRLLAGALAAVLCLPAVPKAQTCPEPKAADFRRDILVPLGQLKEPIELAVVRDGRVFVVERGGTIQLYDPAGGGSTSLAATLDVYLHGGAYDVGGILGIAVPPAFPEDNWVYVYYAPKALWNKIGNREAGKLTYRLSRFRFAGKLLDVPSEQILFEVPSEWETHNSGSMKFGKDGLLYLATGDDACPSCSEQYSPMDERPGFQYSDSQRSTANTNDLRGKVLRIKPEATQVEGKWYSIPAGNLFAKGTAKTRPEIYTMGHRNPYRIFPDPVTGRLYIGEFGPAAPAASERGPAGADQIKITDVAANLGYPYFIKDNQPYCHWDYAAKACVAIKGQTGMKYDPARPVNTSPNNTGLEILPPAKPAILWEHDGSTPDPIPGLKTCGFMAGPVYRFDSSSTSKVKFPPAFHGKWFFFGLNGGGWGVKQANTTAGPIGPLTGVATPVWYGGTATFSGQLHDLEFGTDGALYAVDYGTAGYAKNGNAGLFRIAYTGCLPPVKPVAVKTAGRLPPTAFGPGGLLEAPAGARRLEILGVDGRKVAELRLDGNASKVRLPSRFGDGLHHFRWR
jgi:cytochrome c